MGAKLLQDKFINELLKKYPRKATLSLIIADILRIERESAIRRLNGKVNFSINEMGILARELNISVDQLLMSETDWIVIPWHFSYPNGIASMSNYLELVQPYQKKLKEMKCDSIEMGAIFHTLPLEFIALYPGLCKFYYFKLGRYNIDLKEFSEFSKWEIPSNVSFFLKDLQMLTSKIHDIFYIWNYQTIAILVNDIKYFYKMSILNSEDIKQLKGEIHQFLSDIESFLSGSKGAGFLNNQFSLYVSRLDLGMSYVYHNPVGGGGECMCFLRSLFSYSFFTGDVAMSAGNWIRSMRAVSTLISGTGEAERVLFFKEQHIIVDSLDT